MSYGDNVQTEAWRGETQEAAAHQTNVTSKGGLCGGEIRVRI